MRQSICQHITTCKLCAQFLPNKVNPRLMDLKIPQVPFAGCVVNTIGLLPTMSKGNKYTLTYMCLLTLYLIAVPLKLKTAEEIIMIYIKHILPTTSCSTFILQDNSTEFKKSQLIATFKSLGIKPIYSNPYGPQDNSRLENAHNFLKCTISKFLHNSMLEWDDILPIAAYIYDVAPSVNTLVTFLLSFWQGSTRRKTKPSSKLLQVPRNRTRTANIKQTQMYVGAACGTTSQFQANQRS